MISDFVLGLKRRGVIVPVTTRARIFQSRIPRAGLEHRSFSPRLQVNFARTNHGEFRQKFCEREGVSLGRNRLDRYA